MFHFIVVIFLSCLSNPFVSALLCASNCKYSGHLHDGTSPTCSFVDKLVAEQSCQVQLAIDYFGGGVAASLNPQSPPKAPNFVGLTVLSLFSDESNIQVQYDCNHVDKCDLALVDDILRGDWSKVQAQVKSLRRSLADMLFNSSDLRPKDVCPSSQPCSGQGFCQMIYQNWTDTARPVFASTCANSTNQPVLQWIQEYDLMKQGDVMIYTCNQPSCASEVAANGISHALQQEYILPFTVPIPPTISTTVLPPTSTETTPSTMSTTSAAIVSTSTISTSEPSSSTISSSTISTSSTPEPTMSTSQPTIPTSKTPEPTVPTAPTSKSPMSTTTSPKSGANQNIAGRTGTILFAFVSFLFFNLL